MLNNKLADGRSVWLVQASDDAGWNWDEYFKGRAFVKAPPFEWGGPDWIRSSNSLAWLRDDFGKGDVGFCYQAGSEKSVVGILRVGRAGYSRTAKGPKAYFDIACGMRISNVDLAAMRADSVISKSHKLRMAQGTIHPVTPAEAERLLQLARLSSAQDRFLRDSIGLDPKILGRPSAHPPVTLPEEEDNDGALEGAVSLHLTVHRRREAELREEKIRRTMATKKRLACEVCDFDFLDRYGEIGRGYAQVHHKRPLSERTADEKTTLEDLAVVCANCHVMIHRGGTCRPIETLLKSSEVTAEGFLAPLELYSPD